MQLTTLLEQFGFSEKEAKIYLACLELGQAPVSTIARNIHEQRVTTHYILKGLIAKGVAQSVVKNRSAFYSVIEPDKLFQNRETKVETFKEKLPELMAISGKFDHKPKVEFYEGLEGIKYVYKQIILTMHQMKNTNYSFLGISDIDPKFQKYAEEEMEALIAKYPIKVKKIIPRRALDNTYTQNNQKRHEHIIIDDMLFNISGEIVVHGEDKVAIIMYSSSELSAVIITSKMLHNGFENMFNLIWKLRKSSKNQK
jgi:sugar-specific transcriptional regulator TrmB